MSCFSSTVDFRSQLLPFLPFLCRGQPVVPPPPPPFSSFSSVSQSGKHTTKGGVVKRGFSGMFFVGFSWEEEEGKQFGGGGGGRLIPLGWIEKGGKRSPVRRDVRKRCYDANLERIAPCQENVFAFAFSFSGGGNGCRIGNRMERSLSIDVACLECSQL